MLRKVANSEGQCGLLRGNLTRKKFNLKKYLRKDFTYSEESILTVLFKMTYGLHGQIT